MAFINDYAYYANSGAIPEDKNWGSYQYVSLDDIVNNFMLYCKHLFILISLHLLFIPFYTFLSDFLITDGLF